jgi:hypothetical protein
VLVSSTLKEMADCKDVVGVSTEHEWVKIGRLYVQKLVEYIGAPTDELCSPWVKFLCVANGVLHAFQLFGEFSDKARFPTKTGERKVASYEVMNYKYTGFFKGTLFLHIASGATTQLCSSIAIFLEERNAKLSQTLARIASCSETFCHAPTAFALSPFVYGDKGVVPWLYALVSLLLQVSGLNAMAESWGDDKEGSVKPRADGKRPELRRMCTTISIFLYVRLYAIMRSPAGMLQKQKYSMAVMMAGTTMMPVGWQRFLFPAYFWTLFGINRQVVGMTLNDIRALGVDGAAAKHSGPPYFLA